MTTNDETRDVKTAALEQVKARSDHFEAVRALADEALSTATDDRVDAIRAAMAVAPVKEVAAAAGLSVQRLYQIVKPRK